MCQRSCLRPHLLDTAPSFLGRSCTLAPCHLRRSSQPRAIRFPCLRMWTESGQRVSTRGPATLGRPTAPRATFPATLPGRAGGHRAGAHSTGCRARLPPPRPTVTGSGHERGRPAPSQAALPQRDASPGAEGPEVSPRGPTQMPGSVGASADAQELIQPGRTAPRGEAGFRLRRHGPQAHEELSSGARAAAWRSARRARAGQPAVRGRSNLPSLLPLLRVWHGSAGSLHVAARAPRKRPPFAS